MIEGVRALEHDISYYNELPIFDYLDHKIIRQAMSALHPSLLKRKFNSNNNSCHVINYKKKTFGIINYKLMGIGIVLLS